MCIRDSPQIQGTVQENLTALQGEIDALSAQTEAHQQALAALGKERDALLLSLIHI